MESKALEQSLLPFIHSSVNKWSSAFWRLTLPNNLFDIAQIIEIKDMSGQYINGVLLYGERKGKVDERPHDGGGLNKITDLSVESLWNYDSVETEGVPTEFKYTKQPYFYIPTGKTRKCYSCSGRGVVKCTYCGGRGRYKSGDNWYDCSCGNGQVDCDTCTGYGYLKEVIVCNTVYDINSLDTLDYKGVSFVGDSIDKTTRKIINSTGEPLLEEIAEYPQSKVKIMLQGGLNAQEYLQLQNGIKDNLHKLVNEKLTNYQGDIQLVHNAIERFFLNMPNPSVNNKLLEYEIIPVRVKISVQNRPVYQVKYIYKEKNYILWVYGDEGKIYASQSPKEFTIKAKIASVITGLALVVGAVFTILSMTGNLP